MNRKLSLKDLSVQGKKVLMRVDFNVPLDSTGRVTDDTRITASLPSISYILDHGGSLILMSHLGRPKGKKDPKLSLAPCAKRLSELLHREVKLAPDCIGSEVIKMTQELHPGEVILLENVRFHRGEEHPEEEPSFAGQLAALGDLYVNDAFGTAHRAHASTAIIAKYFPRQSAMGFLMEREVSFLDSVLLHPERPLYAIIGGAKISSKIGVLHALIKKVDALFLGGGMTYTFMKAKGLSIGNSIHEDEFLEAAREILQECRARNIKLFLPKDIVVADRLQENAATKTVLLDQGIPEGFEGVDIGPQTILEYTREFKNARTILWNGPLGVFEIQPFAKGTESIAKALATVSAQTIVGGGDSIAAINQLKLADKMTHLSTGGGATLEYMEFGTLPGIEALSN